MKEVDLFDPIRLWLTGQGYTVSSEVKNCDVVATLPDDPEALIVIELKTRMSLDLVNQGVARKELTDSVYLAIPVVGAKGTLRSAKKMVATLRRLELGLIYVRFLRHGTRVEPILHPQPFTPRHRHKRRQAILREIDHRYAELDRGGRPKDTLQYTAYRQRALRIASILQEESPLSPKEIQRRGGPDTAGRILSLNHYGWFSRVVRGSYELSEAGREALTIHADALQAIEGNEFPRSC